WQGASDNRTAASEKMDDETTGTSAAKGRPTTVSYEELYQAEEARAKLSAPALGITPQSDPAGLGPTTPIPNDTQVPSIDGSRATSKPVQSGQVSPFNETGGESTDG